jgi:hypothetical protein
MLLPVASASDVAVGLLQRVSKWYNYEHMGPSGSLTFVELPQFSASWKRLGLENADLAVLEKHLLAQVDQQQAILAKKRNTPDQGNLS